MGFRELNGFLYVMGCVPLIVGIVFSINSEEDSFPYGESRETSVVTNTTSFIKGPVNCTYGNYSMDDYPVCVGDMADKCISEGKRCVEYKEINCTKSYYCNLMCPMELLEKDCIIALSQEKNCKVYIVDSSIRRGKVGYHTSSAFECKTPFRNATFVNYVCGFCGMVSDYYDVAGNTKEIQRCQSVCAKIEQNKVCQRGELLVYNFVKSKQFSVCGYLYRTVINKTCVHDDEKCISDFKNEDPNVVYSACGNTKWEGAGMNGNMDYIYLILFVVTFLFMTLFFCVSSKKNLEASPDKLFPLLAPSGMIQ
ncbi:MAG: hypothetical protein Harvfovirus3_7 [Harvfovirus sp.]|uniref:Uncharacterized protein n=1 Tax=Harvfovirus sp. TaxID=2487768 RepID=A0A3G5A083_9VIRU|nr:MAG: hypothetical protein Harvfovirus3_7 [Harvfovirus sp.]